eukprot:g81131.t1
MTSPQGQFQHFQTDRSTRYPHPTRGSPTPPTNPSTSRGIIPLTATEYTEQDLTMAWGDDLRQSWEQHVLSNAQPMWINDIMEYTTQQVTEDGTSSRTIAIHNLTYHHRYWPRSFTGPFNTSDMVLLHCP